MPETALSGGLAALRAGTSTVRQIHNGAVGGQRAPNQCASYPAGRLFIVSAGYQGDSSAPVWCRYNAPLLRSPLPTMKLIIKFFSEITIKTPQVRKRFVKQLKVNLKALLQPIDPEARVNGTWDSLEVQTGDDPQRQAAVIKRLCNTPGISHIHEVHEYPLTTLEDLAELCVAQFGEQVRGKVFAVRCKRVGRDHPFSSPEVAAYLGSQLRQRCGAAGISLKQPEVVVNVEIREQRVFLIETRHEGMGGFPLGTMEPVLSLMSGGFDSTVASYRMLQRGLLPHFVFFNLGGRAHEIGVRQIAHELWQRYAASHRLRFISVPFEEVVGEILKNVDNSQMGVVLKRMMLRVADRIAWRLNMDALVTGEAIAQVASQTLPNLAVIDKACERLVLRPLIATSKREIIDTVRAIGMEQMCTAIPEYCGIISVSPAIRTTVARVEEAEAAFDFSVLEAALQRVTITDCRDLELEAGTDIEVVEQPLTGQIVLDIRAPDEQEAAPLQLEGIEVRCIPFFELSRRFAELDPARMYLLYCDRGLMSRMHAQNLLDSGHLNVRVLRKG